MLFRLRIRYLLFLLGIALFIFVVTEPARNPTIASVPSAILPFERSSTGKHLVDPECPPRRAASRPSARLASALSPAELLCRPLASDLTTIPKLFHQSWKSTSLPPKFEKWSRSCRELHPDWQWVLWTDDDNLKLVQKYFPWLEDTYLSLPANIYRADLARNLYMYLFGGVYADLDTECLRPTTEVLNTYNVSHTNAGNATSHPRLPPRQVALFGLMGTDANFEHHIPNAWMAASPGHSVFLLPLQLARVEIAKGRRWLHRVFHRYPPAEKMTGSVALRRSILQYQQSDHGEDEDIVLLPGDWVHPYDWKARGRGIQAVCSAEHVEFDPKWCKMILNVERKGSLSITYWSHLHRKNTTNSDGVYVDNINRDD